MSRKVKLWCTKRRIWTSLVTKLLTHLQLKVWIVPLTLHTLVHYSFVTFLLLTFPPHTQCSWGRPALMSFYWGIRDRDQVAAKYCCYHTEVVSFRKSKISTSDILHHHKDSISLTSCPSSVWVGSWDSKYESTSIQNRQEYDRTDKTFGKLRTDFKQNLDIFRVLNFWSRHRNYIVLNI